MRGENPIRRFARGDDGMSRRQMVQRLLGTAGGGAALVTLGPLANAAEGKPADPNAGRQSEAQQSGAPANAQWSPQFLDAHQNETLTVLAERIIPGSSRAEVNRTIDLLLTVETQAGQRKFLESLSAFEGEALRHHSQPFASLSEEQQIAILNSASTGESGPKASDGDWDPWSGSSSSATSASESALTLRDHFETVKEWVSRTYYSSEVGLRDLGWTGRVMWESWPSCKHPDGHA
ncbi:MAG TPA: gluconate 2-dehydrogenase subunit 3 family protein [Terriglobia bacterium]|nr:gluconate 2-dehydrogenase subunit 3 family protein [Terriglobia bacterium]